MIGGQLVRRFATSALRRHGQESGGRPGAVCYPVIYSFFNCITWVNIITNVSLVMCNVLTPDKFSIIIYSINQKKI